MAPVPISPIKVGHIDDVQELRKAKTMAIPARFVRDMTERPTMDSAIPSSVVIPVIDMSNLLKGNRDEVLNLAASCEEWGFFQVINHEIDISLLERIEKLSMEFFMLPLEEKKKYPMLPGTVQGYGQAFVLSEDQKLDWCNIETIEEYSREIRKLCKSLLKYIAISLSLKEDNLEEMFGVAVQAVRMNYYPPCPRPDLVLGLSPHSDGSALTVLQQGQGSSVGLQILKNNNWVPVQPMPNALVINIGDTLEVLTNGKYKSVEHRAVTHMEKDRLSIVTFYAPSYETELGPLPELVDETMPCKYRRYSHREYNKHYITNKLQGKKTLEFAKIQSENSTSA
ncbi:Non-hem dioxygenase N-terminal domain [Dillenia turbinata]|uniref:Non-hem dioxygenase N-terminal domain n=1 Tax=Dillenia turbinata TaxID=194707 RepID=A0AAN8V9K4_9MAGN